MPTTQQTASTRTRHANRTAKVVEIIGSSTTGFEDAVRNALKDARTTTRNITGCEVENFSVRCEDGEIQEYRVDMKVAFGIERDGRHPPEP